MADKPDHRQRILEKASDKYFALGYSRVTMDELANELGMSKKTLYKYFPAKVELLRAIVQDFIRKVIAEQDRILNDKTLDFEKRLGELLKLLVKIFSKINPSLMRDVQRVAPDVWEIIEQTRQQRINMVFGGLLREGQQKGYVRKDLHLSLVILAMAATIRETLNPTVVSQFPISVVDAFETLRSVFMGGILTDQGRRQFITGMGVMKVNKQYGKNKLGCRHETKEKSHCADCGLDPSGPDHRGHLKMVERQPVGRDSYLGQYRTHRGEDRV